MRIDGLPRFAEVTLSSIPQRSAALVLLLVAVSIARAGDELTPHFGLRLGGEADAGKIRVDSFEISPAFGLTYGHELRERRWLWAAWSLQPTEFDAPGLLPDRDTIDLDIHYVHVGTAFRGKGAGRTQGFVMFGLGLTWVDPPSEFDPEPGASLVVGGGFRAPIRPAVAFRLDVRGYATFTDTTLKGRCGGARCSVDFAGNGPFQVDVLAGLTFAF